MSILPTTKVIRGKGKPRLMVVKAAKFYTSVGATVFTSTTVQEAPGSDVNITSSSAATNQILTASVHGLASGDWVRIAGHSGSTPDINGDYQVSVVDTTHFLIGVDITVGGTGGTVKKIPAFDHRLSVNQRVMAKYSVGDLQYECHAKITAILDYQTLQIDEWKNGTPTDGQTLYVDGWVIDLPRTNELVEFFIPVTLVHPLYPFKKDWKLYGHDYECLLNYNQYISGDTLLKINKYFEMTENDRLVLVPRVDSYGFQYNVGVTDTMQLKMIGDGEGYSGFGIKLFSTELIHNVGVTSGFGYNFGLEFGIGL